MGSLSMLSTSPYIDPDFKIDGDNSAEGPLRGLTFAVKDLYDVRAYWPIEGCTRVSLHCGAGMVNTPAKHAEVLRWRAG